jgi:hypothetical protein
LLKPQAQSRDVKIRPPRRAYQVWIQTVAFVQNQTGDDNALIAATGDVLGDAAVIYLPERAQALWPNGSRGMAIAAWVVLIALAVYSMQASAGFAGKAFADMAAKRQAEIERPSQLIEQRNQLIASRQRDSDKAEADAAIACGHRYWTDACRDEQKIARDAHKVLDEAINSPIPQADAIADADPMSAEISKLFGIPEDWVKRSRVAIWMALPIISGLVLAVAA